MQLPRSRRRKANAKACVLYLKSRGEAGIGKLAQIALLMRMAA